MKLRPRLLVISLAVSLALSVGLGIAITRSGNSTASPVSVDDEVVIDTNGTFPTPGIATNAAVQGTALPDVSVQTLQGDDITTADLVGQPLVINVWGSTCGPCKQELPDFAAAQKIYGDQVRFVGIDYLPASDREERFARDRGVQYELLYDGNGEFISTVGIAAFPVTLFITADGTIVKQTGLLDEAKLSALIESELL